MPLWNSILRSFFDLFSYLVWFVGFLICGSGCKRDLMNSGTTMQSLIFTDLPHVHIYETHLELKSLYLDLAVIWE